jgi:metallo-beta-lactamase class B
MACRSVRILVAVAVLTCAFVSTPRVRAQNNPEWTQPFPAFKLIGNIYWVGTFDLSSYLITTPEGHIIINTGLSDSAPNIRTSVEQLGFKMSDVKILTATHGHFDHVAAMADLKKMTGASLVISERDKELLESGGGADFRWADTPSTRFPPVKVDRTFKDGESISLGGTTLTAHLHAGHTKGATSFTTEVRENGKIYRVVIANMGSINPGVTVTGMPKYPGIMQDYAQTFASQKAMKIDVFLASHASQFRMHVKYKPGDAYVPDRFVDPKGFLDTVVTLERAYLAQVGKEKAGK